MFRNKPFNLFVLLMAVLAIALISLPNVTSAAVPAGFTSTPTNTLPPSTDTPTPTNTPVTTTDTPTPTPTNGTVIPPGPTSPTPTPTETTTSTETSPPPETEEPPEEEEEEPQATEVPLLPVTGQLPPDGGASASGNPRQLLFIFIAFLAALVMGFTSGKRIRDWLASLGIFGSLLLLVMISAGMVLWSTYPSSAAASSQDGPRASIPVLTSQEISSLVRDEVVNTDPVDSVSNPETLAKYGVPVRSGSAPASYLKPASSPSSLQDISGIQRIKISSLKVDAQVVPVSFDGSTWDVSTLGLDVAWLEGTSQPGLGGNTVLAGHINVRSLGNGPFRYLNWLASGDSIHVFTQQKLYVYQVREYRIVKARDGSVTYDTDDPQLTLITCSSWDELASEYTKRRVVYADLVEVKSLQDTRPGYQRQ